MRVPLLPRPSTRAFIREARRTAGYSFFDWLHGYVYARWPYLYIGIGIGEHPLARVFRPVARLVDRLSTPRTRPGPPTSRPAAQDASNPQGEEARRAVTFADTYHGKVVTLASATRLVTVDREITQRDLEHVIPYALARDIVLKNPDHIVALECPCRAARAEPCLPLDVCLIVGEPFASFVAEHHTRRARWITPDEAVEILRAEHERGHVHHAFFKAAMLGRFYAICNCCACCCGAMQAMRNGVPMLASSGYVCRVDADLCAGCGTCAESCQFSAISLADGKSAVDIAACMGCGVCVDRCPQGALALVRDGRQSAPLEIDGLS
jgi:ferredoxin